MMATRKLRTYADTSVFGGCFDDEFANDSKAFFDPGLFTEFVSFPIPEPFRCVEQG